jgi:hypothetical protein
MVQFPESHFNRLLIHLIMTVIKTVGLPHSAIWGYNGCLLLTPAFRSLPRPSSSDSSKASTMDPLSLDHIIFYPFPIRCNFTCNGLICDIVREPEGRKHIRQIKRPLLKLHRLSKQSYKDHISEIHSFRIDRRGFHPPFFNDTTK